MKRILFVFAICALVLAGASSASPTIYQSGRTAGLDWALMGGNNSEYWLGPRASMMLAIGTEENTVRGTSATLMVDPRNPGRWAASLSIYGELGRVEASPGYRQSANLRYKGTEVSSNSMVEFYPWTEEKPDHYYAAAELSLVPARVLSGDLNFSWWQEQPSEEDGKPQPSYEGFSLYAYFTGEWLPVTQADGTVITPDQVGVMMLEQGMATAVPEPAAAGIIIGGGLLALWRRKR